MILFGLLAHGAPTADACGAAFDHMTTISEAEVEGLSPAAQAQAKAMAAQIDDSARRTKFVAVCQTGKVDVACVMQSKQTTDYIACFGKKPSPAKIQCDAAGLREIEGVLVKLKAQRDQHLLLVAAGLTEACTLPKPMSKALSQLGSVPPDYRSALDLSVVAEMPQEWTAACKDGLRLLARSMQVPADEKRAMLHEGCGLPADGVLPRAAFSKASGLVVLPILLRADLEAHPTLLRALAGM